jgi:hypothetical protein
MKSANILTISLIALLGITFLIGIVLINISIFGKAEESTQIVAEEVYNPQINPADFTHKITNKYLTFEKGKTYVYQGRTDEGIERVEVSLTDNLLSVMGVTVAEVRDKEFLNGELIEDTRDWYAQDKFGNVWYFGEDSKEIVNGQIVSRKGSWAAAWKSGCWKPVQAGILSRSGRGYGRSCCFGSGYKSKARIFFQLPANS